MIQVKKKRWEDITINDYKEIVNITKKELDSDLEKSISILAILCECTEDDLYSLNASKLYKLLSEIEWVKEPYKFNHNWSSKHITINGIKYDVVVDINKFTVAQYADLQVYWDKRDDIDYMAKLLTLFIIPNGKTYNNGYDIVQLANIIEDNVSINDFNSICFFFLKSCLIFIKASLLYSNWRLMKLMMKEKDKEKKKQLKEIQKKLLMRIRTIG